MSQLHTDTLKGLSSTFSEGYVAKDSTGEVYWYHLEPSLEPLDNWEEWFVHSDETIPPILLNYTGDENYITSLTECGGI